MTTEDVLNALGRYTRESNESDRRIAAMLGIKRAILIAWLHGATARRLSSGGHCGGTVYARLCGRRQAGPATGASR